MWVQYGNDAKGCCVVLNSKTFQNSVLRKIIYLTDDGKCENSDISIMLEKFISTYKELNKLCNNEIEINCPEAKECLLKVESLTEYAISQIAYLFKHESYKHENEARIIITKIRTELDDIKTVPGNLPKLYIYNNSKTFLDEIILGSKVENPEDYLPLIFTHGAKMWKGESKNQIKVTQSAIQYR